MPDVRLAVRRQRAGSGRALAAPQWAALRDAGLPVVRDAGFTEIAAGATTVVADLPWLRR
jgi:hypothetical protein